MKNKIVLIAALFSPALLAMDKQELPDANKSLVKNPITLNRGAAIGDKLATAIKVGVDNEVHIQNLTKQVATLTLENKTLREEQATQAQTFLQQLAVLQNQLKQNDERFTTLQNKLDEFNEILDLASETLDLYKEASTKNTQAIRMMGEIASLHTTAITNANKAIGQHDADIKALQDGLDTTKGSVTTSIAK